jgi:hypothetical protein
MARIAKIAVSRKRVYVRFDAEHLELPAGKCEIRSCSRPAAWNLASSYDRGSPDFDDAGNNLCEDHLKTEINRLIHEAG